ncbi:hypothetical protein EPR50_G00244600 [Perca flavescens]|uniref:MRN complex-interacting protein N-terminal domain-containing protein n=1 Tax=Perca flavescens TaxID=8167 RepID=A0A484BXX8_PERFV|nr:MRN complex-interacting protein [Perca flavescens]TDG95851.1 hypothetical protein EPR50_G00244600 [Perca flavescens]
MVQEFHVVRCFSCQSFQVHQVKKVNRWSCKLCGEKQSLKKEFGRGSGADCRRHVQKLNAMRGAVMEKQEHHTWSLWKQEVEEEEEHEQESPGSRWSKYLPPPEEAEPEDEDEQLHSNNPADRQHLHGNNPADRKRKRRERQTDGGRSSYTPEQLNWSGTTSAETTSSPSTSLNRASLNQPSMNRASLNQPRSSLNQPSLNWPSPPSMSSGPASRWSCFLSSSESQTEGAEPPVSGRSQAVGGATLLPCNDVITQGAEPLVSGRSQVVGGATSLPCNDVISQARPRPLLPVSSMFDSGEDFSFDDFEIN